jgi:hypothetical protein
MALLWSLEPESGLTVNSNNELTAHAANCKVHMFQTGAELH